MRTRAKKRKTKQQKIWNYIRRNRLFVGGELLGIFEKPLLVRPFINALVNAGYVERQDNEREFADRAFKLKVDTGMFCPTLTKGKCFDFNLQKELK